MESDEDGKVILAEGKMACKLKENRDICTSSLCGSQHMYSSSVRSSLHRSADRMPELMNELVDDQGKSYRWKVR